MKSKILYLFLGLLVMVASTEACGQAVQVVPTVDTSARATSLAGTAVAAFGTATPIPSPTETPVPTAVVSAQGTSLVAQADGSILFTDHKAGIQMTFPAGWLAIRGGEPEFYMAAEKVGTQNEWFLEEIAWLQSLDLNVFRLHAYDLHPEHVLNDILPKINVVFREGDERTLRQIESDERTSIQRSVKNGHKHLSSDFQVLSGVEVLIFQEQWDAISFPTAHAKGTFFKVSGGTVFIDFMIASEQQEALEPEWKQVVESITLIAP
jgi:hypothetical protein